MPLQIIRQDITKMRVDAIVNTTNESMIAYSGVDLAVHTAAGKKLAAECARLAPLGLGQAKITKGYSLPCRYVIHTSGPVWHGGLQGESVILRSCYEESLTLAVEHGCDSVAVPLISSGAYGYPKEQVLKFAIQVITEFLFTHELTVYICVYDRESYTFSRTLFNDILDFIGETNEGSRPKADMCSAPLPNMDEAPRRRNVFAAAKQQSAAVGSCPDSLHEYVKNMDKGFREKLFDLIDASGMTDVACYKKANVDKRTFSKIKSSKSYRPSKQTAIAFAVSLELDLDGTQELLATLGYTLSKSSVFDQIIRYFIQKGNYNIFEINEALFEFDQMLLGSV